MLVRQHTRFPVTFSGTLAYQYHLHLITKSLDLSRKGCRLESPIEAFAGMEVNLFLSLPEGESPILIEHAVVRWCRPFELGIEFQSISSVDRQRLERTIQKLERKDSQRGADSR